MGKYLLFLTCFLHERHYRMLYKHVKPLIISFCFVRLKMTVHYHTIFLQLVLHMLKKRGLLCVL